MEIVRSLASTFFHLRQQNFVASVAQHEPIGKVVDILGRTAEMNEISDITDVGAPANLIPDVVLDRFHVVICRRFDLLDALGIVGGKFVDDAIKHILHDWRQRSNFSDVGFVGKPLQPANFDQHTVAYEAVLAENVAQGLDLARVPPIDR